MRAAALLAAAILATGQGNAGLVLEQRAPADRLLTLETWVSAIESHAPAADDSAIAAMRTIRADELEGAFAPMAAVLKGAAAPTASLKWDVFFRRYAEQGVARAEAGGIQALSTRVAAFGLDRFLKHAAVLHSDIGVIAPEIHRTATQGTSQLVYDGVLITDSPRPFHWMLARAFLHVVSGAADDPAVLLWYQAVASHLWGTRNLVEAEPHIKSALTMFPRDAELHFVRGLIHESRSAPHVRAAIQAQVDALPHRPGFVSVIESAGNERRRAREAFQAALRADEEHVEARIRLGRLLSLERQHSHAVLHLKAALERTQDLTLRYFAQLFLGSALEAVGRFDEASQAYAAASAVFPNAPSPRLSLSRLAVQSGDVRTARGAIALLSEPSGPDEDPWWVYHYERQPHHDIWMARARRALTGQAR